jgi:hypothetical protein
MDAEQPADRNDTAEERPVETPEPPDRTGMTMIFRRLALFSPRSKSWENADESDKRDD